MSELGPCGNKLRYTLPLPPIDSLTNEWVFPDVGRLTPINIHNVIMYLNESLCSPLVFNTTADK